MDEEERLMRAAWLLGVSEAQVRRIVDLSRCETMSMAEAAEWTGIPIRTLYARVEDGSLAAFVPSGKRRGVRVRAQTLARWMEGMEVTRDGVA